MFKAKLRVTLLCKTLNTKAIFQTRPGSIKKTRHLKRENLYCWDSKAQRVTRGAKNADNINAFLDAEKAKYNAIIAKHELLNRPLTVESFAQEFLKPEGNNNFFEYFLAQIDRRKNVLANETYRSYLSIITKIQKFRPNLQLGDIDYKFLCDLETYMLSPVSKKGLGNNQATASKSLKTLRTLVLMAIKNGDLLEEYYPFKNFKIKHVDPVLTSRDYLEPAEILKIESLLSPEKISELHAGEIRAVKRFLFSCYTGLRFMDVNTLDRKKHIFSKYILNPTTNQMNLRFFIDIKMHKVSRPVYIPLIEKALELVDLNQEGLLFGKISNQKLNEHLKEIAKKAKIEKKLTFHVARHSFATICFLYGIPEIVGQRLLGHKNRKFTEVYTHLSQNKLFYEMDKVNAGLMQYQIIPTDLEGENNNLGDIMPTLQNVPPEKLNKIKEVIRLML